MKRKDSRQRNNTGKVVRGLKENEAFWELLVVNGWSPEGIKETMGNEIGKIDLAQKMKDLACQAIQLPSYLTPRLIENG